MLFFVWSPDSVDLFKKLVKICFWYGTGTCRGDKTLLEEFYDVVHILTTPNDFIQGKARIEDKRATIQQNKENSPRHHISIFEHAVKTAKNNLRLS